MYDEYGNYTADPNYGSPAVDPAEVDGAQGAGPWSVDPWEVDGAQGAGPAPAPTTKTWGEIVGGLGTQAANAIKAQYTNAKGEPDWGRILKDGGKAMLAYNAYQQAKNPTPPTGYQGGIPKYQAGRYEVPTQAGLRPGAGGQRYFTDTQFATPAGLPAAQAAMQTQQTRLAQQNQQAPPAAPAQPPHDPHSDAFYGRQPVQGMAAGGSPGRYLQGKTDGMADEIPAQIDGVQPAALAHGEFVIPADVVSHLGNGNSDAGAQQLYKMMDKIRQARTGNKKQGKQINPDKFAPGGIAKLAAGGTVQHFAEGDKVNSPAGTIGTESNLSNWVGPYVTDMLGKGQALSETPYHAYQGPLTAGDSPLQAQAFNNASNLAVPGSIGQAATAAGQAGSQMGALSYQAPTTTAQQVNTQGFTQPGVAQQYMSPYMQQVVDNQQLEAQRTADVASTMRQSDQTRQGAFGGSRAAIMDAEAARNLATQKGTIQAQGLQSAYNQAGQMFTADQGRSLTAQQANQGAGLNASQQNNQAGQFGAGYGLQALQGQLGAAQTQGNLGATQNQAGLANLGAQMGAGAVQQGNTQAGMTADQNAFNQEQTHPFKMVQYQQSLLQGLPLAAQSYNIRNDPIAAANGALSGTGSLLS